MELICYPLLSTPSKRAMRRRWRSKRFGLKRPYRYVPQYRLIKRLMAETGFSEVQVRRQIYNERLFLLKEDWGHSEITASDV
ncbi:MAG: hypothetical protein KME23_17665 [Goleter apudmare HA4340-LM2]|jgi:hypothetical protein|nr:hypothetical protein [Goleter apudmare HA4340-LM2]MBW4644789.1 hypothetical protein [Goleter apudmare HA4340-LM2]